MPLFLYAFIHPDTVLAEDQKEVIHNWEVASLNTMENNFPVDSLQKKKQGFE
jgi:hypothetical protein